MDVINDQNMQRNLSMKNKEAEILGLLFLGDGATISITKLLNMLVPIKMFLLMFQKLLTCQDRLADNIKNMEPLYIIYFLSTWKN